MTHPDYLLLEEMFTKHRKKAFVTCDETCFCWDVEKWLLLEAAQQSGQAEKTYAWLEDGQPCPTHYYEKLADDSYKCQVCGHVPSPTADA